MLDSGEDRPVPDDPTSADEPVDRAPGSRPRLPVGAVLLALLQVLEGVWLLAALGGVRLTTQAGLPSELLGFGVPGQYAIIVVAGLRFAVALGLLARFRAAWIIVMLITGAGLAATLVGYAQGRPDDIRLLLNVASAFYLNQPGVRAVFGIRERPR